MNKKLIILLVVVLFFNSCDSQDKHKKNLAYSITIANCANKITDKSALLFHLLNTEITLFSQNPNRKFSDSSYNVDLKTYKETLLVIDSVSKVVSSLDGSDDNGKFKQSFLLYIDSTVKYFFGSIPLALDIFRNGLDRTPQQKEDWQKYMNHLRVFQDKSNEASNKFEAFLKQHKITWDELKQNGVRPPSGK